MTNTAKNALIFILIAIIFLMVGCKIVVYKKYHHPIEYKIFKLDKVATKRNLT